MWLAVVISGAASALTGCSSSTTNASFASTTGEPTSDASAGIDARSSTSADTGSTFTGDAE